MNVDRATFDLNRDLITSFWMTRLDQRLLILNAASGSWEGPYPLPLLFWDKQTPSWEIWTLSIDSSKINIGLWVWNLCFLLSVYTCRPSDSVYYKEGCIFRDPLKPTVTSCIGSVHAKNIICVYNGLWQDGPK